MGILTVRLSGEPSPGSTYDVRVPELGPDEPLRWSSMPNSIEGGVTFLMSSCFWKPGDEGAYEAAIIELTKRERPAFKFLLGDQVYLDYPPHPPWNVEESFAERYEEYWGFPPYQRVLRSSPNFFACDDHEFWNNYPDRQPHLPYTWTARGRATSEEAARALYDRFQRGLNPDGRSFFDFAVGEVSFFVADPRSRRTPFDADAPHFFGEDQWQELEGWAAGLEGPGVLVIGQPLFQSAGGRFDRSLLSFGKDYLRLCEVFRRTITRNEPHDILVLTGDIHVGRHATGFLRGVPSPVEVHEFVASPASRIGPDLLPIHAKPAPDLLRVPESIIWEVRTSRADALPTADNNVAAVRVSPGTNGRVRFELSLWRVSRNSLGGPWVADQRDTGDARHVPLFNKEIELR
jgi:hypothetical protein